MDWTQLSNITSHSFHRFKIMPITSEYGKQNQKSGIKWASREFNFEKEGQITREKIEQLKAKIWEICQEERPKQNHTTSV